MDLIYSERVFVNVVVLDRDRLNILRASRGIKLKFVNLIDFHILLQVLPKLLSTCLFLVTSFGAQ